MLKEIEMFSALTVFVVTLSASPGVCSPKEKLETLSGNIVLGFETSYIYVHKGQYKGQKIWIEDANKLEAALTRNGTPVRSVWKRANGTINGCLATGRFGHQANYQFKISKIAVALTS